MAELTYFVLVILAVDGVVRVLIAMALLVVASPLLLLDFRFTVLLLRGLRLAGVLDAVLELCFLLLPHTVGPGLRDAVTFGSRRSLSGLTRDIRPFRIHTLRSPLSGLGGHLLLSGGFGLFFRLFPLLRGFRNRLHLALVPLKSRHNCLVYRVDV